MRIKFVVCAFALTLCLSNTIPSVASEANGTEVNANGTEENGTRDLNHLTKRSHRTKRISRGDFVPIEHYPYMVSIQSDMAHMCGGTLIKPVWVLTAANCFSGGGSSLSVVAGKTKVSRVSPIEDPLGKISSFRRGVVQTTSNGGYGGGATDTVNDIALAKLSSPFGRDARAAPVAFPREGFIEPFICETLGWGVQPNKQEEEFVHLMAVESDVTDKSFCASEHGRTLLEDHQICVSTEYGGPCPKDTGGPLMGAGAPVGVVSYIMTEDCASNQMAVYTRVSRYTDWIAEVTAPSSAATWRPFIYPLICLTLMVYLLM